MLLEEGVGSAYELSSGQSKPAPEGEARGLVSRGLSLVLRRPIIVSADPAFRSASLAPHLDQSFAHMGISAHLSSRQRLDRDIKSGLVSRERQLGHETVA